jgi:hypothetical protein
MEKNTVTAEVVGEHPVADVAPGGTVELDPAAVNVEQLVASGAVRLTKRKADR